MSIPLLDRHRDITDDRRCVCCELVDQVGGTDHERAQAGSVPALDQCSSHHRLASPGRVHDQGAAVIFEICEHSLDRVSLVRSQYRAGHVAPPITFCRYLIVWPTIVSISRSEYVSPVECVG